MPNQNLKFVLESRSESQHLSLDDFVAQLDAFRAALERTDASLNGGERTIDWEVVGLSHSSPATIELRPRRRKRKRENAAPVEDVVRAFSSNVELLSAKKHPPAHYDYSTVNSYRALGLPVAAGRIRATVITPYGDVEVLPEVVATATKVLDEDIVTESAYKGLLEFINIHGRKNEFRIYPIAGPNYVACEFDTHHLDQAKEAVGRGVRVHGRLIYKARSPFPYRIEVARIDVLQFDSDLPKLQSLRGSAPTATGDLSSEEFIRGLRDAS